MNRDRRFGLLALVLALAMTLLAACGGAPTRSADTGSQTASEQQAASQEEAAEEAAQDADGTAEDDASESDEAESGDTTPTDPASSGATERGPTVDEDGWYTSKDEVALYIHTYGHLPGNFISKTKARNKGWDSKAGNLDEVCPGMSIGGSKFYNDEGTLPDARGRTWTECDINYEGGYRGAERIVFSNDGLIFYTDDHYETFEQLY